MALGQPISMVAAGKTLDIASPCEQGVQVRVYLNRSPGRLKDRWPSVTVGEVGDPEDAFFVDLDGAGRLDAGSSCEGAARRIHVHWAPSDEGRILGSSAWVTEELPPASGIAPWTYADAVQVEQEAGVDLAAGAKGEGAGIRWLRSPANPRKL